MSGPYLMPTSTHARLPRSSAAPRSQPKPRRSRITHRLLRIIFSAIEYAVCLCLDWIASPLALFEYLSEVVFAACCEGCSVQPCGTSRPDGSAILILGAQEGLGRSAALRFSELGYTVFALCPNRQSTDPSPSKVSPDVSSLLYIWHNRKERARSLPWGLIAPMSLDVWSRNQRARVHETIEAFCRDHTLQLVALVICHAPEDIKSSSHHVMQGLLFEPHIDQTTDECVDPEDTWRGIILSGLTEPLLMIYDYLKMLREASGRVIIVSSSSGEGGNLDFPLQDARVSVANNLNDVLQPLGVRVSSVVTGPMTPYTCDTDARRSDEDGHSRGHCYNSSNDHDLERMLKGVKMLQDAVRRMSLHLIVNEAAVLSVLQRVIESRHPKFVYTIGSQPILRSLYRMVPMFFRMRVKGVLYDLASRY
ncbi:hypothetical protein BV25DRAFT_1821905, partial [Artomyces pyxidatus]